MVVDEDFFSKGRQFMNRMRLPILLVLFINIVPNICLQAIIKESRQQSSKLAWLHHGKEESCDCPKIDVDKPETFSVLERGNVANSFWQTIAQCSQEEKDETLRRVMQDYRDYQWQCKRRFIAAAVGAGANPNLQECGDCGNRPLVYAILQQDYPLAEFLLTCGADPNAKIDNNNSVFCYAKSKNLAELLLKHGANVNNKEFMQMTPLHMVMRHNDCEVDLAQLYIDKEADVNAADERGFTPLHELARHSDKYSCKIEEMRKKAQALFKARASLHAQDNSGKTAIQHAQEHINWRSRQQGAAEYCKPSEELIKMIRAAENKSIIKR